MPRSTVSAKRGLSRDGARRVFAGLLTRSCTCSSAVWVGETRALNELWSFSTDLVFRCRESATSGMRRVDERTGRKK